METNVVADEWSSTEGRCGYGAGKQRKNINSMPVALQGTPIKVFTCKYCSRIFLHSRGLGGHQNAHKREKSMKRATGNGIVPNNCFKKTKLPVEEMDISYRWTMPAAINQDCHSTNCHGKSNYLQAQQPSIYYSELPSSAKAKANANHTGMWPPPGASSSSASPQQSSQSSSFVDPSLDLDLHL